VTWHTPAGWRVDQRGGTWIIYPSPGFVLYVGDAAGALKILEDKA
jgi:hypothetical protein